MSRYYGKFQKLQKCPKYCVQNKEHSDSFDKPQIGYDKWPNVTEWPNITSTEKSVKDTQHGIVGDVKDVNVDSNRRSLLSSHFHSNNGYSDNRKMLKGLLFADRSFIFPKRTLSFLRCISDPV